MDTLAIASRWILSDLIRLLSLSHRQSHLVSARLAYRQYCRVLHSSTSNNFGSKSHQLLCKVSVTEFVNLLDQIFDVERFAIGKVSLPRTFLT